MKKIKIFLIVICLLLCITACNQKNTNTQENSNVHILDDDLIESSSTSWPESNYSQPDNCEIIETDITSNVTIVRVKWDNIEAAKKYAANLENLGEEKVYESEEDGEYIFTSKHITIVYSSSDDYSNYIALF